VDILEEKGLGNRIGELVVRTGRRKIGKIGKKEDREEGNEYF